MTAAGTVIFGIWDNYFQAKLHLLPTLMIQSFKAIIGAITTIAYSNFSTILWLS